MNTEKVDLSAYLKLNLRNLPIRQIPDSGSSRAILVELKVKYPQSGTDATVIHLPPAPPPKPKNFDQLSKKERQKYYKKCNEIAQIQPKEEKITLGSNNHPDRRVLVEGILQHGDTRGQLQPGFFVPDELPINLQTSGGPVPMRLSEGHAKILIVHLPKHPPSVNGRGITPEFHHPEYDLTTPYVTSPTYPPSPRGFARHR